MHLENTEELVNIVVESEIALKNASNNFRDNKERLIQHYISIGATEMFSLNMSRVRSSYNRR